MTIRTKIIDRLAEGKDMINKHVVTYNDKDGNKKEVTKYGGSHEKAMAAVSKLPDFKSHHGVNTKMVKKLNESMMTGNKGYGFHGEAHKDAMKSNKQGSHSETASKIYSTVHKKVKNLTGADDKTAKHYLDSTHGRHLYGLHNDDEYIKKDFKSFKKRYKSEDFE